MADQDFNKTEEWKKTCQPLVEQLKRECIKLNIPCFFTFAVAEDSEKRDTEYINDGFMTGSNDIHLSDDRIKYHMMVASGCIAVPKRKEIVFDMNDIEGAGPAQDPDGAYDPSILAEG